jgi:hypothetical protein
LIFPIRNLSLIFRKHNEIGAALTHVPPERSTFETERRRLADIILAKGFALTVQNRGQPFLVFHTCPREVPPRVIIDVRETTASGMQSKVMRRTRACFDAAPHRAGVSSSEAEFCDSERHLAFKHGSTKTPV